MFSDSILTNMEAEKLHTRLLTFQGVTAARFARVQRQSDPGQPLA
jgi:hypothetical protein